MRLIPRLPRTTVIGLGVLFLATAGIGHIVSLLALPWYSRDDAFARIAAVAPPSGRVALDATAADGPPFRDPTMLTDVCRFDLANRPFHLTLSSFADGFVTIGFHSRHGLAFYGLTIRASDNTAFDLVLSAKARDEANASGGSDIHQVSITAPENEGFVTLSTPRGEDGTPDRATDRLSRIDCKAEAEPAS